MNCIYFIGIKDNTEDIQPIKIGHTNDLDKRIIELNTGSPFELEIKHYIYMPSKKMAAWGEKIFHDYFSNQKRHHEWFDIRVKEYEPTENEYISMFSAYEDWLFDENIEFDWEYFQNIFLEKGERTNEII